MSSPAHAPPMTTTRRLDADDLPAMRALLDLFGREFEDVPTY